MNGRRADRRGFALVTAVILLALMSAVALAMVMLLRADMNRTHAAEDEAQLRQLLLAGSDVARTAAETGVVEVPLPAELAGGKLTLRIEQEGEQRRASVEASVDAARARQALVLERARTGWRVIEARLDE